MTSKKVVQSPNGAQKLLWWCVGVNINVLSEIRSEWQKFNGLGFSTIASCVLGMYSCIFACNYLFGNVFFSVVFAILWGLLILFLNRYINQTLLTTPKRSNIPILIIKGLLSLTVSFTISLPVQLVMFNGEITAKLQPTGNLISHGLLEKMKVFQELKSENSSIAIASWLIFALFFVMEIAPTLLILISPKGLYEASSKHSQNTELMLLDLIAKEQYQQIKNREAKIGRKHEDMDSMPFGGFEFYIDYKTLHLNDMNALFSSLNNLYNAIYRIENFNTKKSLISPRSGYNLEDVFRSHPEDILHIHSIETGNSITFKISTGWKPKVELIKGDFVISLPKGSLALLLTGFLITTVFDYSVSGYKEILEIQKLKKENKILDNQLLKEQLDIFNSKLKDSTPEMQDQFQDELFKFYRLTLANSNFTEVKITQDTLIMEKMQNGNLSIEGDEK
jgi:hypothetical protein